MLVKCKHCQAEISVYAKNCPQCGGPSTAQQIENFGQGLIGIGCLMTMLGGLIIGVLFLL